MTDLDLTTAITAAARAMWDHTFEDGFWDSMTHDGDNAQHCLLNAELAIEAALPVLEKALREQIAAELEGARVDIRLARRTDRKLIHELLAMLHGFHISIVRGSEPVPGQLETPAGGTL